MDVEGNEAGLAPQQPVQLDIIIVGAGIIGFAAAAALSRVGHKITLVEKSTFGREAGFSITVGSNGSRVLNALDFDFAKARSVVCNNIDIIDGVTLELKTSLSAQQFARNRNEYTRTFYRPDLHTELKRLALSPPPGCPVPNLLLGSEVLDVDVENARVTVANGTVLKGDLVIGADGERSIVKASYGDPNTLRPAIFKMFRFILPVETIIEDESTQPLLALTRNRFTMFSDETRTMSWFEGRDGDLQAIDIGYLVTNKKNRKAEKDPHKAREIMLEEFKHYHPSLRKVLEKSTNVTDWEVNWSKPLPHLWKGKSVLIGDAAHSMLPSTGQGCCQGLEDVGALSILLSNLPPPQTNATTNDSLQHRLELMTLLRRDRETTVQYLSGLRMGEEEEYLKSKEKGHWILEKGIRNAKEHMRFLYSYDIFAESKKLLEKDQTPRANL